MSTLFRYELLHNQVIRINVPKMRIKFFAADAHRLKLLLFMTSLSPEKVIVVMEALYYIALLLWEE